MEREPLLVDSSESHRVRVLGRPVVVERYAAVSYARFAMGSSAPVEVQVTSPIRTYTIFPAERVASSRVGGTVLAFDLPTPAAVVVWIDQLTPLFLLPDPIEDDAPVHGLPHVLDVTDFGADPSGRSSATSALQAAINRATGLSGGGTVVLPRGVYRSGTLVLRSNVSLYLAPGALLQGSSDPHDYPMNLDGTRASPTRASRQTPGTTVGR